MSTSRAQKAGILRQYCIPISCQSIRPHFQACAHLPLLCSCFPSASTPPPDHYVCFCSRASLFHGRGSLHSATQSNNDDSTTMPQAQDAMARQQAQTSTGASLSTSPSARKSISSKTAPKTHDAGTSTSASAFWTFADTLDRCGCTPHVTRISCAYCTNYILLSCHLIVIAAAAAAHCPCP